MSQNGQTYFKNLSVERQKTRGIEVIESMEVNHRIADFLRGYIKCFHLLLIQFKPMFHFYTFLKVKKMRRFQGL